MQDSIGTIDPSAPTPGACPSWCEQPAGHPFSEPEEGRWERWHSAAIGRQVFPPDLYRSWPLSLRIERVATETVGLDEDGLTMALDGPRLLLTLGDEYVAIDAEQARYIADMFAGAVETIGEVAMEGKQ